MHVSIANASTRYSDPSGLQYQFFSPYSSTMVSDHELRKFIVFCIEVRGRNTKNLCEPLRNQEISLVYPKFIPVDACAGHELIQASSDAKCLLR